MIEEQIERDLKQALLQRESLKVDTLRGIKSVLLNLKVATGKRGSGLGDDEVLATLSKEAKKRQESADLYVQGGDQVRADKELAEKKIIEAYLPEQASEADIAAAIDAVITATGASGAAAMGQVIGQVKAKFGASADGAVVARLAKEKLNQ